MEQSKEKEVMDKIELRYKGMAGMGNDVPIYIDQNDKYWGNLNRNEEGKPELHEYDISMEDYDNWKEVLANKPRIEEVYPGIEIKIISDFERNETLRFNYMLLDRLRQNCKYYLGFRYRSKNCLWAGDEVEQIKTMKELYNSFPDDKKPQWITMDEIEQYELQMCNNENEEVEEGDFEEEYTNIGMSM